MAMPYLCFAHDSDQDERGVKIEEPEIFCQCCRAERRFLTSEIRKYEESNPEVMQTLKRSA